MTDDLQGWSVHGVSHIPTDRQGIRARIGMAFRSMCGLSLRSTEDAPGPTKDDPTCPECARIAGWRIVGSQWVPIQGSDRVP